MTNTLNVPSAHSLAPNRPASPYIGRSRPSSPNPPAHAASQVSNSSQTGSPLSRDEKKHIEKIKQAETVLKEKPNSKKEKESLARAHLAYRDWLDRAGRTDDAKKQFEDYARVWSPLLRKPATPFGRQSPMPVHTRTLQMGEQALPQKESWQLELEAMRRQINLRIEARRQTVSRPELFFTSPLQLKAPAAQSLIDDADKVENVPHLAWCLNQKNLDPHIKVLCIDKAFEIIGVFSRMTPKRLKHIQELVFLSTVEHDGLYRAVTDALLTVLNAGQSGVLHIAALQGLGVVVSNRFSIRVDNQEPVIAGDMQACLSQLIAISQSIPIKQNTLQVQALLQVIALLLDQMAEVGLRIASEHQQPLMRRLNDWSEALSKNNSQHADVLWQIEYTKQALAYASNRPSTWGLFAKALFPVLQGGTFVTTFGLKIASAEALISGLELDKLSEAAEHFKDALIHLKARALHKDRAPWYAALRYVDGLIARNTLTSIQSFAVEHGFNQDKHFIKGLCDRLERLACAPIDESSKTEALGFLAQLKTGASPWKKHQDVERCAEKTLERIAQAWMKVSYEDRESLGHITSTWDAFWHDTEVQDLFAELHQPASQASTRKQLEQMQAALGSNLDHIRDKLIDELKISEASVITTVTEVSTKVENKLTHIALNTAQQVRAVIQPAINTLSNVATDRFDQVDTVLQQVLEKVGRCNQQLTASRYQLPALLGAAEDVKKLHATYLHNLQYLDEVQNALALYTPTEGSISASSDQRFPLQVKVDEFLDSDKQVLLLLGEAGSGKSTFSRHLTNVLWERYSQAPESGMPIPLFIALAEYPPTGGDLIETYLEKQGFKPETIRTLRKRPFVFILDGFDEIKDRAQSLYNQTQIYNWKGKIIVSARPEYLNGRHEELFQQRGQTTALEQYWITPISDAWMEAYVGKYAESKGLIDWSFEDYQTALEDLSSEVKDTIRRPFLLRMVLELLPTLHAEGGATSITHIGLYDAFLAHWWERSEQRLKHIDLDAEEQKAWRTLSAHVKEDGPFACEAMAIALQKAGSLYASYTRQRGGKIHATPADWGSYFGEDATSRLLLFNAPLVRENNHYRFIHKSIQDYLVARSICGPDFTGCDPKAEAILNQFSIVNEPLILDFLVERVQQQPLFKVHLYAWIEASKGSTPPITIGAANAITILARAGESFSGRDLSGIRIPGADLSQSVCDGTNFTGADLKNVIFFSTWLRNAKFDRAQMQGVQFGQKADIKLRGEKYWGKPCYSPDERYILKRCGNLLRCYDAQKREWYELGEDNDTPPYKIIISANSERALVHNAEGGFLELWSLATRERLLSIDHGSAPHPQLAFTIALSEDGQFFASETKNHIIKVWSAGTGQTIGTFKCSGRINIESLAISAEHKLVAFSEDKKITVASLNSELSYDLPNQAKTCSLVISEDGQWIIVGNENHSIHVWSLKTKTRDHVLLGHTRSVGEVAISANSKFIASGSRDNLVRLWALDTGKCVRTFSGHPYNVEHLSFAKDGRTLHSISQDRENIKRERDGDACPYVIKCWPLDRLEEKADSFKAANSMGYGRLSPDGQWIASHESDNTLWLHAADRSFSQKIGELQYYHRPMVFSPDGHWSAWQDVSGFIVCCAVQKSSTPIEHFFPIDDGPCHIAFSADSQQLTILQESDDEARAVSEDDEVSEISEDDEIREYEDVNKKILLTTWSLETGDCIDDYAYTISLIKDLMSFDDRSLIKAFSWKTKSFFTVEEHKVIKQWAAQTGTFKELYKTPECPDQDRREDDFYIQNIMLSPQGKWLALTNEHYDEFYNSTLFRKIWLYSFEKGKLEENHFTTTVTENIRFTFSPDEQWLAVAEQHRLALYSIASLQETKAVLIIEHGLIGQIEQITWHQDKILMSEAEGRSYLWQCTLDPQAPANCQVRLSWVSSPAALTLDHASIAGTQGLEQTDIELFRQFEAIGVPVSSIYPSLPPI